MRVLQIINSLGTGGAEKLLLETIPLYREKGIEMDILLLWNNDCMFTRELQKTNCCKIHIIKESSSLKDIYNPFSIFKIASILKEYDIAHVHLFPAQYFVAFANMINGNKTKLIFTEHSTSNKRIQNVIFKPFEKFIYSRYNIVVCISEEIKSIYSNYIPKLTSKLVIIHNGVAIDKVKDAILYDKTKEPFFLNQDDKIIIQVAAFREEKDHQTLIKAMKHLDNHFKLFLVGDGVLKDKNEQLSKELGLASNVFFLGQRNDIPSLLKTADFVVLSSFYEGLSLASIEGLASGKPFIASDVKGLTEIVKDFGVLFEQGNDKELATIITRLDANEQECEMISKKSVERANEFNISKMVTKHLDLYKEIYEN